MNAWTTMEGAVCFFAPEAKIEARPGGAYELYFNPAAPEGERGAEGMRILAMQEPQFLSFTWNPPPHLPTVRGQQTLVQIRIEAISDGLSKVTLQQDGWGTGDEWDAAYAYFERAWCKIVLPRLKYYLEEGPIDWTNPATF